MAGERTCSETELGGLTGSCQAFPISCSENILQGCSAALGFLDVFWGIFSYTSILNPNDCSLNEATGVKMLRGEACLGHQLFTKL